MTDPTRSAGNQSSAADVTRHDGTTRGGSAAGPTRLIDRLMWRRDDDGEWQHRLADEWNGNASGRVLWSRYDIATLDTRYADLTCGVAWSHWALGPSVETGHEWPYVAAVGHSVPTRRTFVTLALGPLYVTLHVVRPRRGFDG